MGAAVLNSGHRTVEESKDFRILVVDDEMMIRRLLERSLASEGYGVSTVGSVAEALGEVERRPYDLIILDRLLPDGDGMDACRRIRARYRMPIIMLTTKGQLSDRVEGLGVGADDYLVKPFELDELVARVKAQLRRARDLSADDDTQRIRVGRVTIDPTLRDAVIEGKSVGLTAKEFELLHLLAQRRGRAVSRETIVEELWPDEVPESDKIVAVYMRRLRQKIEQDPDDPKHLQTVRGFGYKFE
jgi:DNA-binding response OmpR family regulator